MTISTKRGDSGTTSLFGAKRIGKHHPLIQINGQIDELQVVMGLLKPKLANLNLLAEITSLQQFLYQIMADLAGAKPLTKKDYDTSLARLEANQEELSKQVPIANKFVLPGQNESEAAAHLVRVKVREVERLFSKYQTKYPKLKKIIPYFNRLSDYFFVLSQFLLK